MNEQYLKNLPAWCSQDTPLDLVLSDDIDSLASCILLKQMKNWSIKYFYDFERMYKLDDLFSDTNMDNEKCYVDVAVMQGKAFDNHVSRPFPRDCLYNKEMVNPNLLRVITNNNYFDKYAGSTLYRLVYLQQAVATHGKGKMLLLCGQRI